MDICVMKPDEDVKDPAKQQAEKLGPDPRDKEGIRPNPAANPEPNLVEQEQWDEEAEEQTERSVRWHSFKSP
jgi:hypothetical protein